MRKILASAVFCAALFGLTTSAFANVIYSWTLSGADNGSGQLTADAGNNIISLSGVINGHNVALAGGSPGAPTFSADGAFIYDNILYPNGSAPGYLDVYGILLSSPDFSSANIFGDGLTGLPGTYTYGVYELGVGYTTISTTDTFTIQAPEPGALALIAMSLLSLIGFSFLRRHQNA